LVLILQLFVKYLYHNITLNIPKHFGPQGNIIRESNKVIQLKSKLLIGFMVYYFARFPDDGRCGSEHV